MSELNPIAIALENSRKLDRISEQIEYIEEVTRRHEKLLFGVDGHFGLAQQMRVMWRAWTWILCTLSAMVGSILTIVVKAWLT